MSTRIVQRTVRLTTPLLATTFLTGCLLSTAPAETVLAGSWQATSTAEPNLTGLRLEFNPWGDLTQVRYQTPTGAVLNDDRPNGTTAVDGDHVIISGAFHGNPLALDGTLSPDHNAIQGHITLQVNIGGTPITLTQVPALLTRI